MRITDNQKKAAYRCGTGELLKAAYQRDFTMNEMGKCKTKFPTFEESHQTPNKEQKHRVDAHLADYYRWSPESK
jgi:hypothetical protein